MSAAVQTIPEAMAEQSSSNATAGLGDIEDFRLCCADHAFFLDLGILALPIAADNLQWLAERWHLIEQHGQDEIQRLMAQALSGIAEAPMAPEPLPEPEPPKRGYCTADSTVAAFWFVASLDNPDHLKRWLADHPRDVAMLQKLWEAKHARP